MSATNISSTQNCWPTIIPYMESVECFPIAGKRVLVGGCFDLFHYGHLKFLQKARAAGDCLIIALESDENILHSKGRLPIHTQLQRAEILAALREVDHVLLLPRMEGFEDYLGLVERVCPHILAVTEGDPQYTNKEKQAAAIGGRIMVVNNLIEGLSSTIIRSKLMD